MLNQENLATILMCLIFFGVGLALAYIWNLTRFFNELRDREPEVWERIGKPTLTNMLLLPFTNFRKYYAFFQDLKGRRSDYRYAGKAYRMLNIGLAFCVLLLFNLIALCFTLN